MIRTIKIDVNAANPQLPLQPVSVFEGSAASLVLLNVPRSLGKRTITAVSVVVINPDSMAQAYEATREGSAYQVTIPAEAFGGSGSVENGIMISASGTNERGETVDQWILGSGNLVVMQHSGTVKPGERRTVMHWFVAPPASPHSGDVSIIDGVLAIFDGAEWRTIGGGAVSVKWSDIKEKPETFPPQSHTHTKSEITDFPAIPEVVAPASDMALGKAADAKLTGDALAKIKGLEIRTGKTNTISVTDNDMEGQSISFDDGSSTKKVVFPVAKDVELVAYFSQLSGINEQDITDFLKYKGKLEYYTELGRVRYSVDYKTDDVVHFDGSVQIQGIVISEGYYRFSEDRGKGSLILANNLANKIESLGFKKLVELYEKNKTALFADTAFKTKVEEIIDEHGGGGGGDIKYDPETDEIYVEFEKEA